jgi:hypothetical protein
MAMASAPPVLGGEQQDAQQNCARSDNGCMDDPSRQQDRSIDLVSGDQRQIAQPLETDDMLPAVLT